MRQRGSERILLILFSLVRILLRCDNESSDVKMKVGEEEEQAFVGAERAIKRWK